MTETKRKNTSNKIGANFESRLIKVFNKYREKGEAYIIKVPTEVTIIRNGARIVNAIHRHKSDCLDFIGVLKNGSFITFEAKTYNAEGVKSPKPFSLSNIKEYQFQLNKEISQYANSVFYIIEARFDKHSEVYLLHADKLQEFVDSNDRKSIPYDTLRKISIRVEDLDILRYII